jgi:hypothetical protein
MEGRFGKNLLSVGLVGKHRAWEIVHHTFPLQSRFFPKTDLPLALLSGHLLNLLRSGAPETASPISVTLNSRGSRLCHRICGSFGLSLV